MSKKHKRVPARILLATCFFQVLLSSKIRKRMVLIPEYVKNVVRSFKNLSLSQIGCFLMIYNLRIWFRFNELYSEIAKLYF